MKKFLSTILAVVMVLSSMAVVVSANDDIVESGIFVGTTKYDSFSAAQTAAAANTNKEIIISGTVEFGSRQGISVEGLHLRGINDAKIIPSETFKNGSATNIKGLLNIGANKVKVTDITFDGSIYGDTISSTTDFVVLRCNQGTDIELTNVTITGSPKSLMTIGTTTTEANVIATNLNLYGENKLVSVADIYADLDLAEDGRGSAEINGGVIDAYVLSTTDSVVTVRNIANVYGFVSGNKTIYTSPEHLVETYLSTIGQRADSSLKEYVSILKDNDETVTSVMIDNIIETNNTELAADFVTMIDDMVTRKVYLLGIIPAGDLASDSDKALLNSYKSELQTILNIEE